MKQTKRSKYLMVRVTADEHKQAKAAARRDGLPVAEWCRALIRFGVDAKVECRVEPRGAAA